MRRRDLLKAGLMGMASAPWLGCRNHQYAKVNQEGASDMVGSHQAGAETYKPLVDDAVAKLLGRHLPPGPTGPDEIPPQPLRVCFVGVRNDSSEEIGDFKNQLFQIIDSRIIESQVFQPISQHYVEAGLREARLRPDDLFIPENARVFTGIMEQQQQPFDYLLFATLTSGTTRENRDYQRDYLLTLELVSLETGAADKQSASLSKSYYHSRMSRLGSYLPWNR